MAQIDSTQPLGPAPPEPPAPTPRNRFSSLSLPWIVSIAVHIAIAVIGMFVVWSSTTQKPDKVIVPLTRFTGDVVAENLADPQDTEIAVIHERVQTAEPVEVATAEPPDLLAIDNDAPLSAIDIEVALPLPPGTTTDRPELSVELFGVGGNARTVVFVVDASGSLLDVLPQVINELARSIRQLSTEQRFTVIFFQGGRVIHVPVPHAGLKRATADAKRAVIRWIALDSGNIRAAGSTNPLIALEAAIKLKPELIFVMSDDFRGAGDTPQTQRAMLQRVARAVGDTNLAINTIEFNDIDRSGVLRRIAERHGGTYKHVGDPLQR